MDFDCTQIREKIAPALLYDLPPAELEAVRRHVAACPGCAGEWRRYDTVFQRLESIREAEPPRHFSIPAGTPAPAPRRVFGAPLRGWALAAGLAGILLLAGLAASRFWWRWDGTTLMAGFGIPPAVRSETDKNRELAALKSELLTALDARLTEQDRRWQGALRQELTAFGNDLAVRQQRQLEVRLTRVESRFDQRLQDTQTALRSGTEQQLTGLYELFRAERGQEWRLLNERIGRLATHNELRASQTDTILATLLDAAETRINKLN